MTSGNHIWDKKEIIEYIVKENLLLRPANFPAGTPGRGLDRASRPGRTRSAVLNLMGRVFLPQLDCPFRKADEELRAARARRRRSSSSTCTARRRRESQAHGLVPRRAGERGGRHPSPRADRGRARAAQGHRLHHRPRDDRARPTRSSAWTASWPCSASSPRCRTASSPPRGRRRSTASVIRIDPETGRGPVDRAPARPSRPPEPPPC